MMIHHHTKYKEIHGVDEIIIMDKGEHKRLHNRLRREGKCNIPSAKLHKISMTAFNRTNQHTIYAREIYEYIHFYDPILTNVRLIETVCFNKSTGSVYCLVAFRATNKKDLYIIGDN